MRCCFGIVPLTFSEHAMHTFARDEATPKRLSRFRYAVANERNKLDENRQIRPSELCRFVSVTFEFSIRVLGVRVALLPIINRI